MGYAEQDPLLAPETTAWEVYQGASAEGRMMFQLDHAHVLSLLGITFQPIRLLLELAPLGDLKGCIKKFQKARVKLSRRTLKHTMIQVCGWVLGQGSRVALVSVSDPKPTPAQIAFSILRIILEAIYAPDEVWGQD